MLKVKIDGDVKVPLSGFTKIATNKHSIRKGVVKDSNGVLQTIFTRFRIPTFYNSSINLPYMYGYTTTEPSSTPITNYTKARSYTFGNSKDDLLSYHFTIESFNNIVYEKYLYKNTADQAPDGINGAGFYASQGLRIPLNNTSQSDDTVAGRWGVDTADGGSICRARNIPVGKDLVLDTYDLGVIVVPRSMVKTDSIGEYLPVPQGFRDTWLISSLPTKNERDIYVSKANSFIRHSSRPASNTTGISFSGMHINEVFDGISFAYSSIKTNLRNILACVDFNGATTVAIDNFMHFVDSTIGNTNTPPNHWLAGARNVPDSLWDWLISPVRFNSIVTTGCFANTNFNINFSAVNDTFNPKSCYAWLAFTPYNQPVENITLYNLEGMFNNAQKYSNTFNPIVDGSVTSAAEMFYKAVLFDQPIADAFANNNIVTWEKTFSYSPFNQSVDGLVTSSATNISGIFERAVLFNQPLDNWDTSNVTTVENWILRSNFNNSINHLNWENVVNATRFLAVEWVLEGEGFNQPIPDVRIPKATTVTRIASGNHFNQPIQQIFEGNTVLSNIDLMFTANFKFNHPLNNINTSNVKSMNYTFNGARDFNQPLDNWDTSNVGGFLSGMMNMFDGAVSFNQNISMWDVSNVSFYGGFDQNTSPEWTADKKPNFV